MDMSEIDVKINALLKIKRRNKEMHCELLLILLCKTYILTFSFISFIDVLNQNNKLNHLSGFVVRLGM